MSATSVILLICSVVDLSSACCTPDQWEGEEAAIGGYANFLHNGLFREFIVASYDAVNNRTAAFLNYQGEGHGKKYKIVTRYDNDENVGKLYIVDLKTNRCSKKTLKSPFRRACIPDDARSVGNYSLGLSDDYVVTGYEISTKKITAFLSVQDLGNDECFPVGETIYGKVGKFFHTGFVQNIGFINISRGIRNETVFDVPEQCEEKEDFSLADELTREHYIMAV